MAKHRVDDTNPPSDTPDDSGAPEGATLSPHYDATRSETSGTRSHSVKEALLTGEKSANDENETRNVSDTRGEETSSTGTTGEGDNANIVEDKADHSTPLLPPSPYHSVSHPRNIPEQVRTQKDKVLAAVIYFTIGLVSLVMRLLKINYSDAGTPVFDEKHYVPQAQQMLNISGFIEENPGYGLVVHPPMGKWLLSITGAIFGYDPIGWRLGAIIAGVIVVLLISGVMHKLTGSIAAAIMTALLLNMEGIILGMSRIGMLDIFLTLFISIIVYCVVADITHDRSETPWHRRWWLLGAGVAGGGAMSVKLSGVYYPALCGIVLVFATLIVSKSIRETLKALGMGLVFFLVAPLMVFITTWLPWFASETSAYRHIAEAGRIEHHLPEWLANILPDSINSFMSYQLGVLKFHTGLKSGDGFANVHPWESKPSDWLVGDRPMLFYTDYHDTDALIGDGDGISKIYLFANPAVWWLFIPIVVIGVISVILHKGKHIPWLITLAGIAVGILPWFATYDRQQYLFYTASFSMFIVMGLVLAMIDIARLSTRLARKPEKEMMVRTILYITYGVIVMGVFILYIPWFYGVSVSEGVHDFLEFKESWAPLEKKTVN